MECKCAYQWFKNLSPIETQVLKRIVFDRAKTNFDSGWEADYFYGLFKDQAKRDSKTLIHIMGKLPKGITEEDLLRHFLNDKKPENYFKGVKNG